MSRCFNSLLGAVLVFAASAAAAQTFEDDERAARELLVENGGPPVAVIGAQEPILQDGWRLISVYAVATSREPTPGSGVVPRRFIARQALYEPGNVKVRWTSQEECPSLRGVLAWMSDVPLPSLFIPGLMPRFDGRAGGQPVKLPTHATGYSLWGQAFQADGALATVRIEGTSGLFGDWAAEAERSLEPCWRDSLPGG